MKQHKQGVTLVELLISLGILGVLTLMVLGLQNNTRQITSSLTAQNTIQEDLRVAAAIIGDEIQRAYYVFPPCGAYSATFTSTAVACGAAFDTTTYKSGFANVNFSNFTLAKTGNTTLRPDRTTGAADARTWTVADFSVAPDAPFLAMIVAPARPDAQCGTGNSQNCYVFVAYYPVLRSSVTRDPNDSTPSKEALDGFADNEKQWVLMEYREALKTDIAAASVTVPGYGSLSIPATNWSGVGSTVAGANPSLDPNLNIQKLQGSIPALYRGTSDLQALALFTGKMDKTAASIGTGSTGNGVATILVDNIQPRGFRTYFPQNSIDERGVTEVRIQLQAGIASGTNVALFPKTPLEIFASPRNLPAGFTGNN
jgi:prepilin-type N-terminal cleavage/methylation domain-containing protein